ncbi:MAG: phosphatidylserine/phosphatidylglycerophosphate/cardiolipin synthase family protein, partial [Elusimicrobiaceae bacterium]|nr:phosphatidylserine/phosphatidylglycerophosphate/cardiolipin synthase family protein [Elusimicrobiaceae bacterium]
GYHVHPQNFSLGNAVLPFENGDDAYPAMCQLIRQAKHYVWLQSYIFNNDTAGQSFVRAFEYAAQKGVQIKILVDGVGLNYSSPTILTALKKIPHLETAVFLPSRRPVNLPFVNLRNHRKILIVDGTCAFFGGMNISEGNLLKTQPKEPIQDITFQATGSIVEQISRIFEEDWSFSTQTNLTHVPQRHNKNGSVAARIIPDGPDSNYGKLSLLFIGAINSAQQKIQIVTPYFLPEEDILSALEVAAMRGLQVEIILPQKSNIWGMDHAMRANFVRLLTRGIKIYRTCSPFDHSKLFLVDNEWLCIGSANWDVRSLKLNFECIMECLNKDLAANVATIIEHKKQKAQKENLTILQQRPWYQKLLDNAFKLLTPYY